MEDVRGQGKDVGRGEERIELDDEDEEEDEEGLDFGYVSENSFPQIDDQVLYSSCLSRKTTILTLSIWKISIDQVLNTFKW